MILSQTELLVEQSSVPEPAGFVSRWGWFAFQPGQTVNALS